MASFIALNYLYKEFEAEGHYNNSIFYHKLVLKLYLVYSQFY